MNGQPTYRLVVLVSDGGPWRVYRDRSGIMSAASAEMLGREEVCRVLHRTAWQRVAYRVSESALDNSMSKNILRD